MFAHFAEIQWLGIVLATVASAFLGGIWFTLLFGKLYHRALNKPHPPKEKPAPLFIVGPMICGFVTVVASAVLLQALHIDNWGDLFQLAVLVGLGYMTATTVNTGINPNIPRPLLYGLVSGGYFFCSAIVSFLILFLMR